MTRTTKRHLKKLGLMSAAVITVSMLMGGAASAHSLDWQQAQTAAQHPQGNWQHQDNWHNDYDHELHMQLDAALKEHGMVGVAALKAEYMHDPNAAELNVQVSQNTWKVVETVGNAYPGTKDELHQLWNQHLAYYKEYLWAATNHDEAGKQQAREKLAGFAWLTTNLLTRTDRDTVDWEMLRSSMVMHGEHVTTIIDDWVKGDMEAANQTAAMDADHMGHVAHIIAVGAPRQHDSWSMRQ